MELAPVLNEYRSMVEPYILSYVKTAPHPRPGFRLQCFTAWKREGSALGHA